MTKVLLGPIVDGSAGGVDKYILNMVSMFTGSEIKIDLFTNKITDNLKNIIPNDTKIFEIPRMNNPKGQYSSIKNIVKSENYKIVYFCFSTAIGFMAVKGAYNAGAKTIVHSHSSGYDSQNSFKRYFMSTLHKILKKHLCKYTMSFLTCSQKASEWLFSNSVIKNNNVILVKNAVDINSFYFDIKKREKIRKELKIDGNFVVGNIANFLYPKNHKFMLKFIIKVLKQDSNVIFILIGDGPNFKSINNKVKKKHLEDRVFLLGKKDVNYGYMNAFDAFVLPSIFEGMPIVSIEAQCSKLPCLFSDKITKEAQITNACKFLPINDSVIWKTEILKLKDFNKKDVKFTEEFTDYNLEKQKEILKKIILELR